MHCLLGKVTLVTRPLDQASHFLGNPGEHSPQAECRNNLCLLGCPENVAVHGCGNGSESAGPLVEDVLLGWVEA
jgi:hypothetical protein